MKTRYAADDTPSIAQRLKEIQEERLKNLMGQPLEGDVPVDAPSDIDWAGVYGYRVAP